LRAWSSAQLLAGAVARLIAGEVGAAKFTMCDYAIATVGFESLGALTGESPQHLEQVFDTEGGLTTGYLFEMVVLLAQHQDVDHELSNYLDGFAEVGALET